MALFVISGFGLLGWSLGELEKEVMLVGAGERWRKMRWVWGGVAIVVSLVGVLTLGVWGLKPGIFYPDGAIGFLQKNGINGNLWADYGWGSYLLWKLPGVKTFVDGRMPSWRRETAPFGESLSAMSEHIQVIKGEKGWEEVLEKYKVGTMLVSPRRESGRFGARLTGAGWAKVYEDEVASVYIRPE